MELMGSYGFLEIHKAFTELFDVEPDISISWEHRCFSVEGNMYCYDFEETPYQTCYKTYVFSCDPFAEIDGALEVDFSKIWELYEQAKKTISLVEDRLPFKSDQYLNWLSRLREIRDMCEEYGTRDRLNKLLIDEVGYALDPLEPELDDISGPQPKGYVDQG